MKYPSDVSEEQFEKIRSILEACRRKTKPTTINLYEVFCGVLYLLKSGCQWRMIPKDYPKWQTCYAYWQKWSKKREGEEFSALEKVFKKNGWRGACEPWEKRKD
ncbi:Mobile element protein [hydrothermal vent metagenome]|uniref:Mobile element protein n=1 Tax=hydrothermal vent metagenome TaxID=652676 RepID=A0A3B1CZL5_9ZZZZ